MQFIFASMENHRTAGFHGTARQSASGGIWLRGGAFFLMSASYREAGSDLNCVHPAKRTGHLLNSLKPVPEQEMASIIRTTGI
jgi:hypothetical protein